MARIKQTTNPFYVVLLAVGVLFFITASTYFVMTLRADRLGRDAQNVSQSNALMKFVDQRGGQLLAAELLLLGLCTAAAMASDGYWGREQPRNSESEAAQKRLEP